MWPPEIKSSTQFTSVFDTVSEGQNSEERNCRISENRAVSKISSCRVCTIIVTREFCFNVFYFVYGLGVMPIAAGEGGGGDFRPLALKKPLRKNMLAWHIQLVTCRSQYYYYFGPSSTAGIELNRIKILDKKELTSSSDIRSSKAS